MELTSISDAPRMGLPFILRVLTAGSNDQSAREEMLEVVAMGMPFRRTSVPPAVVRVAPSRQIALVLNDEMVPMTLEMYFVSISEQVMVLILAVSLASIVLVAMSSADVILPPFMTRVFPLISTCPAAGYFHQFCAPFVLSEARVK